MRSVGGFSKINGTELSARSRLPVSRISILKLGTTVSGNRECRRPVTSRMADRYILSIAAARARERAVQLVPRIFFNVNRFSQPRMYISHVRGVTCLHSTNVATYAPRRLFLSFVLSTFEPRERAGRNSKSAATTVDVCTEAMRSGKKRRETS